tara:strand:- start:11891 stop:12538 length:648 start_codon:yes stop_codon:yes gene_type:complete
MKIQLTEFSKRHFDKSFNGTKILNDDTTYFEYHINSLVGFLDMGTIFTSFFGDLPKEEEVKKINGYADFCKLLVVHNFTDARTGTLPLDLTTLPYLRTGFSSRTEEELPVLSRWLEVPKLFIPKADYLVLVLYTREQLVKEHESKSDLPFTELDKDTDYGVVAILGQMSEDEEPMKPITMLRNALGTEEGGSGVPLDRVQYKKSVSFWERNATVK